MYGDAIIASPHAPYVQSTFMLTPYVGLLLGPKGRRPMNALRHKPHPMNAIGHKPRQNAA
jgi:hypothetical protein